MKLGHVGIQELKIPFKVSFRHSSAERASTEAIIASAHSTEGITGYGEGCPRDYVTGETIKSCIEFLQKNDCDILRINNPSDLNVYVNEHHAEIDRNPAAWCAIETAILDLLGKVSGQTIEAVCGLPEIQGDFHYTAVLGVATPRVFTAQLERYIKMGFDDFKIKVSGDLETDMVNLETVRLVRAGARIRLDANNLWDNADSACDYLARLPPCFWALEEPVRAGDYAGMEVLSRKLECKIILDESFLRSEDIWHLQGNPERWIPNIRISKMGGLLRSLAIVDKCRNLGIRVIIGAQVGETSILTRVAIAMANVCRDTLVAQEGAYGTYLLERDIVSPSLMFGQNGMMKLNPGNRHGLGLEWMWSE